MTETRETARYAFDNDAPKAPSIAEMVSRTEQFDHAVAVAIFGLFVGWPLIRGLCFGDPFLGLANAAPLGLLGWGVLTLVRAILLRPIRSFRYQRAATLLVRELRAIASGAILHRSWIDDAPGAIAIARHGPVWLTDRATGYCRTRLARSDIVDARVVTITRSFRPVFARPSPIIGVPLGKRPVVAVSTGSSSRLAGTRVRHAVSLSYAPADGGDVRSTIIEFGADFYGAHAMVAMLVPPRV